MSAVGGGSPPPIIIVTGGVGTSAEQVVNTVLAQYRDVDVTVEIVSHVHRAAEVERAVAEASEVNATIVHTLVDAELRALVSRKAAELGVVAIDLVGPLIEQLSAVLDQEPLGLPGLYRDLHRSYFERIDAIDYALSHDDGINRKDWPEADVVVIGVSRAGKTPLSVFLSVLGYKAANLPIVPQIPIPPELYQLPRRRVVGLTIDLDRLLTIRRQRSRLMGMSPATDYTRPAKVADELELAQRVCIRGRFHVIDVTHQPIEVIADEVVRHIGDS